MLNMSQMGLYSYMCHQEILLIRTLGVTMQFGYPCAILHVKVHDCPFSPSLLNLLWPCINTIYILYGLNKDLCQSTNYNYSTIRIQLAMFIAVPLNYGPSLVLAIISRPFLCKREQIPGRGSFVIVCLSSARWENN